MHNETAPASARWWYCYIGIGGVAMNVRLADGRACFANRFSRVAPDAEYSGGKMWPIGTKHKDVMKQVHPEAVFLGLGQMTGGHQ